MCGYALYRTSKTIVRKPHICKPHGWNANIEVCLEQLQGILVALLLRAIDVDVDIDIDIANDIDIEIGIGIEIYIDICLGPCLLGLRIGGAII